MGSAAAPDDAIANLNDVADALGTDLRVNTDQVVDAENNVNEDPELPATQRVNMVERYLDENGEIDLQTVQEAFQDSQDGLIEIRIVQRLFQIYLENN